MKKIIPLILLSIVFHSSRSQTVNERQAVLDVINKFFVSLEKQDSIAFRGLHVKGAKFYILKDDDTTVRTASREVSEFSFRKEQVLKERMRSKDVVIEIHEKIATVWAPYDLWVNDVFSHCGVDVFTLFKMPEGWKIANCSYSMETKGCGSTPLPK